ncbi:MAG: tRNA guanosine(34) transglycosylase Tgt [Bdellovibrionales bacterium RIFOXYD12_FULL_39_22]|nr:MAG: tRNA guanosine(34) transglycosylase Tgt [Bdellovibrionales bacterium RIFOXYB1_FULL_39_21]OFZ44208.1 MAG: tRNA guanosine(34) transglycosylase Tgt [Bdellovibrionales bacterium RIFOXYC12_FULL_39_17]OFZ46750.1 MAG: tRNA guanosine(34) transglycosylase Tgt [Bdellovibrionales bacterium RIFOXYC1_FULL_39_130]OFZ75973.1 MAG: tRNA guanosine(34) transglycosylase Tgt [Bdellovibrionales bacterium RIFOXYD1_FULL_39_84]OFZ95430.1 MAG: tRNA guanosine(34) transglycosylase Tgt [Bdellovibrionales bacterium 
MPSSFFTLVHSNNQARAGLIKTVHGEIETPIFMPVGTRGSVKTMTQTDLENIGAQIILGNTYHLYLRPGHELVAKMGGLHKFMAWDRPILTDSGGYQVFSLSEINKVSEEGVRFQSHIDGSYHLIGPEKSMEIQKALGSDIVMAFDECPALPASVERLRSSMELTLRWAQRCRLSSLHPHQHLFGIVQGGLHHDLRKECLERLQEMGFAGYALGGLSVGEKNEEMVEFCANFVPTMPASVPRYLMGVGTPLDILQGVKNGIDMFDCVLPTRNARNGQFLTRHGPLNIKNAKFLEDKLPPDPTCDCMVCQRYSRAYIRHLYNVGEYLAGQLITYHNLYFYLSLMRQIRLAILNNTFDDFFVNFYNDYSSNSWMDK